VIGCAWTCGPDDERRLRVVGEVDMASAPSLRRDLLRELERVPDGDRFVVDLGGIGFFSAAGLHVLEDVAAAAGERGAVLVLGPLSVTVELVLSSCAGALGALVTNGPAADRPSR
jgi:anti-anti-sigma factor